jgi:putative nucleotidyltransferase with HDIG domain
LQYRHLDDLIACLKEIFKALKDKPEEAIKELREIGKTLDGIVPYQDGHNQRVAKYALAIAEKMGFSQKQMVMVEASALLHDLGKVGIDEKILLKPSHLTTLEKQEIESHVMRGYYILQGFTEIPEILNGVKSHHEKWDGSGYPDGLENGKIPLIGRILAVADAYDTMVSKRPYRQAITQKQALAELKKFAGIQFDEEIVSIFLQVITQQV